MRGLRTINAKRCILDRKEWEDMKKHTLNGDGEESERSAFTIGVMKEAKAKQSLFNGSSKRTMRKAYADGVCKRRKKDASNGGRKGHRSGKSVRLTGVMTQMKKHMSDGNERRKCSFDRSHIRSQRYTNRTRTFPNLPLEFIKKPRCVRLVKPKSAFPLSTK